MGQWLSRVCFGEEEDVQTPVNTVPLISAAVPDFRGQVDKNGECLASNNGSKTAGPLYQNLFREEGLACLVSNNGSKTAGPLYQNFHREEVVMVEERWIKCYSSHQRILLVGEGDFSFSSSLATAFGSAANMIATSLDSQEFLCRNYRKAMVNLQNLVLRGGVVMHGMDATEMSTHFVFKGLTFDRIVYNFPHSGFFLHSGGTRDLHLQQHRRLVSLFLENAKKMIAENGEIHITHKSNGFFRDWNLQVLASNSGLRLIEEVNFNFRDYPGYRTKFGFGGDGNFNCNPSKTYKFELGNCHQYGIEYCYGS